MADLRRHHGQPNRIGSMLVGVGCLGILGLTFGTGFYAGRYWTRASLPAATALDAGPAATAPPARRASGGGAPNPPLTFYEELTAPLAAPAAPARPDARRATEKAQMPAPHAAERAQPPAPRGAEKAEPPASRVAEPAVRAEKKAAEPAPRRPEPAQGGSRFTVQIAAYSARASAEALRSSISASGHEAYIVESAGPSGTPRYRVRVGSYPSREAAAAAASQLSVPGGRYVTTR